MVGICSRFITLNVCLLDVIVTLKEEVFYLTMHSTHFIYGYVVSDMVKDHSDSERETCCCHMGYSF